MGSVKITPYFCIATEMVTDLANASMESRQMAPPHLIEEAAATSAPADCTPDPIEKDQWARANLEQQAHALDQVDVYLDYFILS